MINPDNKYDFSELGFWKYFAFVRFIYKQLLEYKSDNFYLRQKLSEQITIPKVLTSEIKQTNNTSDEVISDAAEDDNDFYKRREGEKVEDFLIRIGTFQPPTKTVKSANTLIEEARQRHIRKANDDEEKISLVSESAINRIGKSLEEAKLNERNAS